MQFEDAVCEFCGGRGDDVLLRTRDLAWRKNPGEFNIVRCRACDLAYTSPRPRPADMPRYYEDWYNYAPLDRILHEGQHALPNRYIQWVRLRTLERTGSLTPQTRVLDVGAGFGVQLAYTIKQRGVRATALDFDPACNTHSLVRNTAELRSGDLLTADLPAESFDLVTLYETLEHVYRPLATLREAFRVLRPGGRVVVEVPDFGSALRGLWGRYWFPVMLPVHLTHFTKASLDRMVRAAGFEPRLHASMFVPFESSGSLLVAYCTATGAYFHDVTRLERMWPKHWYHLPFFAGLIGFTFLFDFPMQSLAWLAGRTGAQTLIAVKPGAAT